MAENRWSQLRLMVTRNASQTATWSLILRTTDGNTRFDRKLGYGTIPCPPGSATSVNPLEALAAALDAANDRRSPH